MAYNHAKGLSYVCEKQKICFIPIPKNASTTFRRELESSSIAYKADNFIENPEILQKNKVICIAREPIDRFCSAYLEILIRTHDCPKTLEKEFYYIKQEPQRFLEFIKEIKKEFYDAHVEPQLFYISDSKDDRIHVDEIWLMNNVNCALEEAFGIKVNNKHNRKRDDIKKQYIEFLEKNTRVRQIIERIYERDISFYEELLTKEGESE